MGRNQAQSLAPDRAAGGERAPGADRRIAGTFNAALLGIMGRRRLVVLAGPAAERIDALVRLARHLEVDGALVLPAGGRPDAAVEHLIRAAAHVSLPADQRPARFDALIDHLAGLLESMGTGVLLVENADRLSAATLSDLIELSGTQSDTGRFLQIVLAGTDALMRRMAQDERNLFAGIAVAVPMTSPAAEERAAVPSVSTAAIQSPGALAVAAPPPTPLPAAAEPVLRAQPQRTAAASGAAAELSALTTPIIPAAVTPRPDRSRLQTPLPRMHPLAGKPVPGTAARQRTLWTAGAGVAAVALVIALAASPRWVRDTADDATHSVADFIERFRSMRPADATFTNVARTMPVPPAAPATTAARSAVPAPARLIDRATRPSLPAPAAAPPKPSETEAAAPPALEPPPAERPNLPVEALSMREPSPPDTGTAVPEPAPASPREIAAATAPGRTAPPERPVLRDTPALRDTPVLRDAPQQRDPGAPTDGMHGAIDPATRAVAAAAGDVPRALPAPAPIARGTPSSPAAVTALVTQARRQIDDRRLTTPIGDNALETVRAMEAAAAAGIEPSRLRAAIVDSYLRLGALAEQRGQYPLARVYYRRAQQAIPDHDGVGARLEAIESRLEENRGQTRSETRQSDGPEASPPASDAPKLR